MSIVHKYDAALNDQDKSFTVPTGYTWRLDWLHAILVSDGTVGNRQIVVSVLDDSSVLRTDFHAGAVQAASLTRHYAFQPGVYRETTFTNNEIQVAIPMNLILMPGWSLRVYESTGVSGADDMTISFQITEHTI